MVEYTVEYTDDRAGNCPTCGLPSTTRHRAPRWAACVKCSGLMHGECGFADPTQLNFTPVRCLACASDYALQE